MKKLTFIVATTVAILFLYLEFIIMRDQQVILRLMQAEASEKRVAEMQEEQEREAADNERKILSGEIKLSPETQKSIDAMVRSAEGELRKQGYAQKDIDPKQIEKFILRFYGGGDLSKP